MADYCSPSDVSELLGRDLTATELHQFPLLLKFATVKINRELGITANIDPVPDAVNVVALDMLVRAYRQSSINPTGADMTVGPFQFSAASVWLTAENKADLAAVPGAKTGAFSIDTCAPTRSMHAQTCSSLRYVAADGTPVFGGANYCDCGADIAGLPLYEAF